MLCLLCVFPNQRDCKSLTSCFQVSVLWKDSPENPKNASGDAKKESKAKKPASKASKPSKKAATDEESPSSESD